MLQQCVTCEGVTVPFEGFQLIIVSQRLSQLILCLVGKQLLRQLLLHVVRSCGVAIDPKLPPEQTRAQYTLEDGVHEACVAVVPESAALQASTGSEIQICPHAQACLPDLRTTD